MNSGAGYFKAAEYSITYSKPGFEDLTLPITSEVDGWYIGNLFFGGLIGFLVVDPATGAMWKLPAEHRGNLVDPETLADDQSLQLKVVEIDELSSGQQTKLVELEEDYY